MLKVAIFALLFVASKSIVPFTSEAADEWFNTTSTWVLLPHCRSAHTYLAFTVNREYDHILVFKPSNGGRFFCGQDIAQLTDISIWFHSDRHPEIMIRLTSPDKTKYWTVTSNMFSSPQTQTDLDCANAGGAIKLNSLDSDFANELDGQEGKVTTRDTAFELDWVKELLVVDRPRRTSMSGDPTYDLYTFKGLPVTIDLDVFNTLDKVRREMEVHPMLPVPDD